MKKILSVLAISTLVFGSATAKKTVNLSYRNGATLWAFGNNGESDDRKFGTSAQQSMSFFNLNEYNTGSDSLKLTATGDVLSFSTQVNASLTGWNANKFNHIKIGANFGAFNLLTGFSNDGEAVGSFRVKQDVDAGNWEGTLFERFKPGSIFTKSYANFSINQVNIGGGDSYGIQNRKSGLGIQASELFLQAGFNFAIPNSDASFKLLGTVISDRAWIGSSNDGSTKGVTQVVKTGSDGTKYTEDQFYNKDDNKDNDTWKRVDDSEYLEARNGAYNDGHLAYTIFAIFSKPSVFNAQAFIKMSPHCLGCDSDQVFVPGAYVEVTAIKGLDLMGGFTMSIVEGTYEDYAFDLRARYAVNSALSITYFGNISVLNGDIANTAAVSDIGLYSTIMKDTQYAYATSVAGTPKANGGATGLSSNRFMWNNLHVRFALTDSIVAMFDVGALTDIGDGINVGPQKGEGTNLSITPAAQFYASKAASILVGFNVTFRGIGKEEHPVAITNPDDKNWTGDTTATQQGVDLGFAIPVLFRVKM